MPHNISETSTFSDAAVALPDNGEVDGIESIEPAFEAAVNRGRFARDLLIGHLSWSGDVSVSGSSTVFTVTLGAINAVCLSTAGSPVEYFAHASSGGTASLANVEGSPGALSADTWYYVYAYRSGTSLAYEISTTAPTAARVFKTSNTTRRYLTCFRTDSAGAPLTMRAVRGVYRYRRSALSVASLRVLNSGTATTNTAVALAALIPPHARLATIRAELVAPASATAIDYAFLRTDGDAGAGEVAMCVPATTGYTTSLVADLETDASQEIAYRCTSNDSSHTPGLTLYVDGWLE